MALGLGFILLAISVVESFVLFLRDPKYSLTALLLSLLTFSGTGRVLTDSVCIPAKQRFAFLFVALAIVTVAYVLGPPLLFQAVLTSFVSVRVVVPSLAQLPLGLTLEHVLPNEIRFVRLVNENFVPWAWGLMALRQWWRLCCPWSWRYRSSFAW